MHSDNPLDPADLSLEKVAQNFENLKSLVTAVLVILLVLTGGVNLYLFKQASMARKQVEEHRPKVQALVEDYQKNNAPLMGAFLHQLYGFAQTNPDFVPILKKYPLQAPPPAQTGVQVPVKK